MTQTIPLNIVENLDTVILGDHAAGATPLSPLAPNFIRAFRVEIHDVVTLPGQNITIVAQQIAFVGPTASIDTSGVDAPHSFAPGNKSLPPGSPGTKGKDGLNGADGTNAGNVIFYAGSFEGNVKIRAVGGAGGRGQDGGDASAGGPFTGAQDREPDCSPSHIPGQAGQAGGQGGMAGAPGSSGSGGNVDIFLAGSKPPVVSATLDGGAAPAAAMPGLSMPGGPGGPGVAFTCAGGGHNFGGPHGGVGPQGRAGGNGAPPTPQPHQPRAGDSGLLNGGKPDAVPQRPCHPLPDNTLAAQCSPSQLWAVLTKAEDSYLNGQYNDAAARLLMVATIGKLLGQNAMAPQNA